MCIRDSSYVRGVRVELDLDEEKFVGGGVYLFSSVLEHFLAQYVLSLIHI